LIVFVVEVESCNVIQCIELHWGDYCTGIAPNILWTIFVRATFGTVNACGVDGNKEFDQNSVRKGIVLGLGIGIAGIVGTGIYAWRELIKIVIAEQRERAMEEQAIGEEILEGDSSMSSFGELENPQLGESVLGGDEDVAPYYWGVLVSATVSSSPPTHRREIASPSPDTHKCIAQRS